MQRIVVGAAIVRRGSVLAAQRAHPPALAGRWELPGGKVEQGEAEVRALARECREELGCDVVVGGRVGPDLPTADGSFLLRVYACTLADGSPMPKAREHRALRWVSGAELQRLRWLDADLPLVPHLEALINGRTLEPPAPVEAEAVRSDLVDLDEPPPPPKLPRRVLLHPVRPLVVAVTSLLLVLGLTQTAVVASGAADEPTKVDYAARMQAALFPAPGIGTSRSVALTPVVVLAPSSTCRVSSLLPKSQVTVAGTYSDADGSDSPTEVLFMRYASDAAARKAVADVRLALIDRCTDLQLGSFDAGPLTATYEPPTAVEGDRGLEVIYSGTGSLQDSSSGSTQPTSYSVRGDVVVLARGRYVVEVAAESSTYAFSSDFGGGNGTFGQGISEPPEPLAVTLAGRLAKG